MPYVLKKSVVEAMQWSGSNWHEVLAWIKWDHGFGVTTQADKLHIGLIEVEPGEWVIWDQKRFDKCSDEWFEDNYQQIPGPEES